MKEATVKEIWIALASVICVVVSAQAAALQQADLSLKPLAACEGAGRPAPKMKETVHAETVGAAATTIDLNGDGWCDWIMTLAYPTNTGLPEYGAKEAILLGTDKGARTFGNIEKMRQHWKQQLPVPDGLVMPDGVTGMAPVLVAYSSKSKAPYFIGFSNAYPDFMADADSYAVYQWNTEFDTPQTVSNADYLTVMKFLRKQYCEGTHYANQDFQHPETSNADHPLEVVVCSPQMADAIKRAERGVTRP